jgi:hypothetical protein
MAEEKNLWKQLKNNTKSIIWTRIESSTGLGIPDLFGFYKRGFWLELKIITNNKLNFSAHQIAWIHRHYSEGCPVFVLAKDPLSKTLKLFSGSIALSVIHCPLTINPSFVPSPPVPGPRAGISCCICWVAGLPMVAPVQSSISLHSHGPPPLPLNKKTVQPGSQELW